MNSTPLSQEKCKVPRQATCQLGSCPASCRSGFALSSSLANRGPYLVLCALTATLKGNSCHVFLLSCSFQSGLYPVWCPSFPRPGNAPCFQQIGSVVLRLLWLPWQDSLCVPGHLPAQMSAVRAARPPQLRSICLLSSLCPCNSCPMEFELAISGSRLMLVMGKTGDVVSVCRLMSNQGWS